ncbi:hypothetical protein WA026_011661 [Henosepilachna vigintioctopunctata]|uniref:Integrin beta n=1 Tax=Henosepilachna vigintioctopunctata TaxID=420089 RepID=A0AAW1TRV0_9CUCU
MIFSEKWYIFHLGLLLFTVNVFSQRCEKILECGICLQQPGCAWCSNPTQKNSSSVNNVTFSHCFDDTTDVSCPSNWKNSSTSGKVINDQEFKSEGGTFVQMKPQKIRLDLRIGKSYDLHFQYRQAENYPVDLYYIIDNSSSMFKYRQTLANLGKELIKKIMNITNDLMIGFGSFVDKLVEPYASTAPNRLKNPCPDRTDCITPYSFRNHMPLSDHFDEFTRLLLETNPSGNLDHPEGGFDALMQAIVCKKEIGWRPQARHLIVFSTDAGFHIAGDGKLGGVVKTNDAKCHMVNNDYDGLFNDYPSVSHLNYIAIENNINIIFAIPNSRKIEEETYRLLSKEIKNSKMDNTVSVNNSQNIINLVVSNYRRILSSITIGHNAPENIKVQIKPHCKHIKRNGCKKVKLGEVINFTATIELLKCNDNLDTPITISLKPDAVNESLIVEVNPLCKCDCEDSKYHKINAADCYKGGDLVCGVCNCHKDRFGRNCECDKKSNMTSDSKNCKEHENAKECSGVGTCLCGTCHCNRNPYTLKEYSGRYCECDNDSCEKEDDKLCGGRGTCDCGKCVCNAGWTGSSCNCPEDKKACIQDGYTNVCSGNGTCSCGKCQCQNGFSGTFCEICPTCDALCPVMLDCVVCTVFGSGKYSREECKLKCIEYNITSVDQDIVEQKKENEKICRETIKKCEIIYKYSKDEYDHLIITVSKSQKCEPNLFVWVLGVIGSVILLGFLTLIIWKIITTFHDKREYQKFCKEQKESKWHRNDNPLYKNATTTFENPYYPH